MNEIILPADRCTTKDAIESNLIKQEVLADQSGIKGKLKFTCLRVKEDMQEQFAVWKQQFDSAIADKSYEFADFCQTMMDSMRYVAWEEEPSNTIMTAGKDAMLTNALKGSAYTAAVYVGLISSISYVSVPVAADTMASHATWTEAGTTNAPTFAARVAATFGTASAGSLATSAASQFTMTGAGTIKGAMIVFNGATSSILNTTGTLYAAGLFSGDKPVIATDIIQVSYTTSLT